MDSFVAPTDVSESKCKKKPMGYTFSIRQGCLTATAEVMKAEKTEFREN